MTAEAAELIAFVTARLDEDETAARAAGSHQPDGLEWHAVAMPTDECPAGANIVNGIGEIIVGTSETEGTVETQAPHIARHDPARVLRDVAADRLLLATADSWRHYDCEDSWYSCSQATDDDGDWSCADESRAGRPCNCGLAARVASVRKAIASRWSDHPGYRQRWKP